MVDVNTIEVGNVEAALKCCREMVESHFPHHREYQAAALALELDRINRALTLDFDRQCAAISEVLSLIDGMADVEDRPGGEGVRPNVFMRIEQLLEGHRQGTQP